MIREYSIAADGKALRIYPRVPLNEKAYLSVRCPVLPNAFDDKSEVDAEESVAVVQWVLYRARMVDGDASQANLAVADKHMGTIASLLGIDLDPNPKQRGSS
jgi:hypothetical protein